MSEKCGCFTCLDELDRTDPLPSDSGWWTNKRTSQFIVCPTCGNKRCPGAKDHRNTCTNSNAPGQKGSMYE
jgi:hypothetical protein